MQRELQPQSKKKTKQSFLIYKGFVWVTTIIMMNLQIILPLPAKTVKPYPKASVFPRLKPNVGNPSNYLNHKDYIQLKKGLALLKQRSWTRARSILNQIENKNAKNILLWLITRANANYDFHFLVNSYKVLEGWPDQKLRLKRIETSLIQSKEAPSSVLQWLEVHPPQSLKGQLFLANTYKSTDQREKADSLYKSIWHTKVMPLAKQKAFQKNHAEILRVKDYYTRADSLLWRGGSRNRTRIINLRSHLSGQQRKLITSRLNFSINSRNALSYFRSLPVKLTKDPALQFEYSRWLRRHKKVIESGTIFAGLKTGDFPKYAQSALWLERKLQARKLISEKEYSLAYQVISKHNLQTGKNFAEGEWLSGWLALQFLKNAQLAKRHFENFSLKVTTPISKSRGYYWLARTYKVLNDSINEQANYTKAARYKTTFYGQLALESLGLELEIPQEMTPSVESRKKFYQHSLISPLLISLELEKTSLARKLFYTINKTLETPEESMLLCDIALNASQYAISVRMTKTARNKEKILFSQSYPIISYFNQQNIKEDKKLLLSISRQESEFNPVVVSPAGARGLMQIIPSTAKMTARRYNMKYYKRWLIDDPGYNVKLAYNHLKDLKSKFHTSYPLIIAAYNAGGHNVEKWLDTYGNPGEDTDKVIDWIESIPFSETRNYVQRVMENLKIYETRLYGEPLSHLKSNLKITIKEEKKQ